MDEKDDKQTNEKKYFKKGLTNRLLCGIMPYANRMERESLGAKAGVAELADARDLKSRDTKVSYRFDPGHRHHRGLKKINIAE